MKKIIEIFKGDKGEFSHPSGSWESLGRSYYSERWHTIP
jgi:hypothetical protein